MSDGAWRDNLFAEKSLWQVWRASRAIPSTPFNKKVMRFAYISACIYVAANVYFSADNAEVVSAISRLSTLLVSVTTAILGFLIAGFSIFIASTPKTVSRQLIQTQYESTSISWFKQIMFNFLNVFSVYLVALSISLSLSTITPLKWANIIEFAHPANSHVILIFNSFVLAGLGSLATYSILRLKSFIWTMYQGLLINVEL